jgi:hypothetical protein
MTWILIVSGIITAGAGLAVALFPRGMLDLAFGVDAPQDATLFFARHWGVLILAVGALVVCSAYAPAERLPILIAASVEKFAVVVLVFFGPLKRTLPMTAIACGDGLFTILYVAYLAGLFPAAFGA